MPSLLLHAKLKGLNLTKLNISLLVPHTYLYSCLLNYEYQSRMVKMLVLIIILKIYHLGALFSAKMTEIS